MYTFKRYLFIDGKKFPTHLFYENVTWDGEYHCIAVDIKT
jgi:hypothetical protein